MDESNFSVWHQFVHHFNASNVHAYVLRSHKEKLILNIIDVI